MALSERGTADSEISDWELLIPDEKSECSRLPDESDRLSGNDLASLIEGLK